MNSVITEVAPFIAARLQSPTLAGLLGNLNEIQLTVPADGGPALVTGDGYRDSSALGFTQLVLDWQAITTLRFDPGLPAGIYHLRWTEDLQLSAKLDGRAVVLPDGPVVVDLQLVSEEE